MLMEIQELIGIKSQLAAQDRTNYLNHIMSKYGFKEVGSGSRSKVYKKSDDFVIKIFKQSDQAYKDWVLLSIKNRDNPHFPKIIGRPVAIGKDYYAIRIEPLKELVGGYGILSMFMLMEDDPDWKNTIKANPSFGSYLKKFPQLLNAMTILKRFEDRHPDYNLDIHSGNIMLRNGTPVFIDPFFN